MALSLFTKTKKAIIERAQDDYATKMRLKYKPYYHAMEAQTGTRIKLQGRDMVMLSSNDYLGLSFHPKVIEACGQGARLWGTSTTGARISNGSRGYHVALEEKLAAFLGREACHVHAAGYLSCMSSVASFAQKGDIILADKNIHSCLWDGIRLSMATVERFSHNNPASFRSRVDNPVSASSNDKLSQFSDAFKKISFSYFQEINLPTQYIEIKKSEALEQQASQVSNVTYTHPNEDGSVSQEADPATLAQEVPKVGRNDPCPCGSGKKYKQCHGRLA